ncbi:hypothetical protein DFQ01_13052 [Paenibacillus cellulosilyticus]|uniref:Uncharacterized protein n=1 Tax=Paenibacillus cellulosilyticus TaxID=375489 RepID=A0A2V2YP51_9BACL|nr:hypothetical protein [Paenibacillus cellulosilyticus]PWV94487.1 hypothetical protein DFQ01_13052 [Paenibacillus cellulosilyticus]QKS44999.1 hypothetical protein HUB94_11685 [Paenibacillus cellulosilyticus]
MRTKIKITINGLIFICLLYKFFYFESDLNSLLFWALVILQIGVLIFVVVRKYWGSIIKLNLIPVLLLAMGYLVHAHHDRQFEKSWQMHGSDEKKTNVKIAAITDFKWDKMYTFGAYTGEEDINRRIGQNWAKFPFRGAPLTEGQSLVLFMYKGKVSHDLYMEGNWDDCLSGCGPDVELSL